METIQNNDNKLLKRKELQVMIKADKNPGFAEVQKKIAEHFKVDESLIAVKRIDSRFGRHEFTIEAFVYHSANDKNKTERKPKVKKEAAK